MLIKSLVTCAAFALVISVGSASAAEDFSTTSNVPAEPLTASQMAAVTGAYIANPLAKAKAMAGLSNNSNVLPLLCNIEPGSKGLD